MMGALGSLALGKSGSTESKGYAWDSSSLSAGPEPSEMHA